MLANLFLSFIPAGILAAVLWLTRNLIKSRLIASVKHEFNVKLETLKTELRSNEEKIKADLRAKEAEISALRSGAMNAMAARQIAIDKRQLEAIDQLWDAFGKLAPARFVSSFMARLKFDELAKEAERNPSLQKSFEMITKSVDPQKMDLGDSHKAKPFVSPMAWAYFSAYQSIALYAVIQAQVIKFGMPAKFLKSDSIVNLIKTALPHQAQYVDQWGDSGFHYLLEELEQKLFQELQNMLTDANAYKVNVDLAAEIVKQANSLMESSMTRTEA